MIERMNFFMAMIPPTATHQQQKIRVVERKGRHVPLVYDGEEVAAARSKLTAHLAAFRPSEPLTGPVSLLVKWCFPLDEGGRHHNGEWRTTRPDTDNVQKLLKDCMTGLGFWRDDAQVCSEVAQKFWADVPGIYIEVGELRQMPERGSQ